MDPWFPTPGSRMTVVFLKTPSNYAQSSDAMQVSAMKPMGINENSLSSKVIEEEKDIIIKQLNNVPDNKKNQIIQGKLNKFVKENTLLGQALITDPKKSVSEFISEVSKNNNISLNITSMDLYTI